MFDISEFVGREVCLELIGVDESGEPEIISGTFDSSVGDFICVRGSTGAPFLFNERYIKSIYLRPEKSDENNDD